MKRVIGLAVGRGTGPEVAAVFERVLGAFARLYATDIQLVRSPRTYHSYASLKAEGGVQEIGRLTQEDAAHYERFCRTQAESGTRVIFRTAVNAQSLYLVRQRLQAVKVDAMATATAGTEPAREASLLLVRDQAQGFYTGENQHAPGVVRRTMEFSREITGKVLACAVDRAWRQWPGKGPSQVVMAYKFHLLDGALDAWVTELATRYDIPVRLFQPDTVNRNLITHGLADRTVVVAGNEWADIMHVVLLDRFGSDRQENRCTENVHLHPDVRGLVEYQTVHGSADDLEGLDRVNPVATVRAAAAIAERYADCAGAVRATEDVLATLAERDVRTPDLGGRHSTTAVVDALLAALPEALERSRPGPLPGQLAAASRVDRG
ncbi:isocitrate/isopropylmalate family dehydrogenase [Streptomyces subrutilus]|uniref:isocitrate/isopropylmalate family dehydrogenase n=1 Tax=Streptomyces subrutilus TaxID=36818 RepID=UPI002E159417|nr:isocitrate/isopropylmalate family dehydrogenase [Streptomyces subrutilus]